MMGLNEFYRFYKKDLFRFYTQYSIIPSFHYSMLLYKVPVFIPYQLPPLCVNKSYHE